MIDSNREEFEKLSEIAERLHTVFYNEDLNQYLAAMINSGLSVKYIQGAWYAFQEQQKKIARLQSGFDELQARVDEALRFYNEAKSPHNIGMIQMAIYLKGNKDEN